MEVQPGITLDVALAGATAQDATGREILLLLHGYPECSWLWRGVVDPILDSYGPGLQLVMPDQVCCESLPPISVQLLTGLAV